MFLDIFEKGKYNINMNILTELINNNLAANRVIFTIFGREIYWYGFLIGMAMIIAICVGMGYCKLKKYPVDMPVTVAAIILPTGILMARLFSIIFEDGLVFSDFFHFETGGLSIIGAIIGGGLGLLIYILLRRPEHSLAHFDILCVVLILAQAIGRWGNYFNEEVYGEVVEMGSALARFPFAVLVNGVYYEALFFYESCLNLLGFVILSIIFLKVKEDGLATGVYCIYYGVIRSILETRRQSMYVLQLMGVPVSLVMSIMLIVLGIVITSLTINKIIKKKKKGTTYENKGTTNNN